jgi:TRAP-type C4-dicarboxylate transport system permease small subunit
MKNTILAIDRFTTSAAMTAAQILLAIATACAIFQVTARFLLGTPSDWSEVLTRIALIWMVYLGIAAAIRKGALVSVDALFRATKGKWRRALEVVILCATSIFLLVLLIFGSIVTWRVRFQEIAGLEISMAWAYLAIPLGSLFALIAVAAHFCDRQNNELDSAV